ncbi:Flp family type IVb pilin [uncultured Sphingorhabdus sp.]|mgnify:FL=1|uniref:Flp family type IVb pilin n=1 Tax=uncultured Sphingorhabdus sp. TaxID=1686106 RepID=UPI0026068FCA|nr:Flp family type IVb pilin [uncultured Sphingorhabdus sp.]HMS20824.1 Flp family type IVb pilin [Sphingorhabdus sp.]
MRKFVTSFLRDDSGASAAEYALILAIVGAGIAVAAIALGGAIGGALNDATTCISTNGQTCN